MIEKSSSRIRDHLANERTYLAWMRTAIAMMGFGIVILRLRYFLPVPETTVGLGWELGFIFALLGLAIVIFSTQHYFKVMKNIETGDYQAGKYRAIAFSVAVILLGCAVFYFILSTPDSCNINAFF